MERERIYVWPNSFWLSFVPYIWFCKLLFMRCVGGEQWFNTLVRCSGSTGCMSFSLKVLGVTPMPPCRPTRSSRWLIATAMTSVIVTWGSQSAPLLPGPQVMGKEGRSGQWLASMVCGGGSGLVDLHDNHQTLIQQPQHLYVIPLNCHTP